VTSADGSFGDAAAEMAPESEVEAPLEGASAPAGPAPESSEDVDVDADAGELDEVVEADAPVEAHDATEAEDVPSVEDQLAERTADLQRLQAEFLNYKRRVDRDRALISDNATYKVLQPIIEVLDTIDRAREHGELDGGFKAVAEQLERIVGGLGLTRFGQPGDAFDPTLHEALSHLGEDPEVDVITAKVVAKAGYKINDRVVRAAQVLVVDPVDN
jgi:molecular chaperone GrpE